MLPVQLFIKEEVIALFLPFGKGWSNMKPKQTLWFLNRVKIVTILRENCTKIIIKLTCLVEVVLMLEINLKYD